MTARPAGAHACRPVFPLKDNIPTDRFPIVTLALIVANAIVYFLLQDGGWELTSSATGDWPVRDYALVPCDISGACEARASHVGGVASVFTSMFMHHGILTSSGTWCSCGSSATA